MLRSWLRDDRITGVTGFVQVRRQIRLGSALFGALSVRLQEVMNSIDDAFQAYELTS